MNIRTSRILVKKFCEFQANPRKNESYKHGDYEYNFKIMQSSSSQGKSKIRFSLSGPQE